MFVIVTIGVRI